METRHDAGLHGFSQVRRVVEDVTQNVGEELETAVEGRGVLVQQQNSNAVEPLEVEAAGKSLRLRVQPELLQQTQRAHIRLVGERVDELEQVERQTALLVLLCVRHMQASELDASLRSLRFARAVEAFGIAVVVGDF